MRTTQRQSATSPATPLTSDQMPPASQSVPRTSSMPSMVVAPAKRSAERANEEAAAAAIARRGARRLWPRLLWAAVT